MDADNVSLNVSTEGTLALQQEFFLFHLSPAAAATAMPTDNTDNTENVLYGLENNNTNTNISVDGVDKEEYIIFSPNELRTSDMPEYKASLILLTYILPIIIFGGTCGNVLSFVVLVRKRMRSKSVYFYLAVLACVDTAVLYLSAFKTWFRVMTGIEALHFSVASCKLFTFFFLFALHLSAWLIVVITLERFTVVWFPFKAPSLCSLKRAAILLTSLCLLMVVYNIHVVWTITLEIIPTHNGSSFKICTPPENNYFMNNIFEYMKLASYSILPFVIVFILNLGIIFKVYQQAQAPRRSSRTDKAELIRSKAQSRITYMLLTVTFTWLVLTAPFTLWCLATATGSTTTVRQEARYLLWKIVFFLLMYLNHSINFYLYCLAGKRFRRELQELFCVTLSHRLGSLRRLSTRTLRTPILNSRERDQHQHQHQQQQQQPTGKGAHPASIKEVKTKQEHLYPLITRKAF